LKEPGLFRGFPLEEAIRQQAKAFRIELEHSSCRALVEHALAVAEANPFLHLTAILEPGEFVDRHLGESFAGASLLDPSIQGMVLDLGSGNGYPGLPLAAAREGLRPVLAEASAKKAAFLREVLGGGAFPGAEVLEGQVSRVGDLDEVAPLQVVATRAAVGWPRIVPRLAGALAEDGVILVWAGEAMESIRSRTTWRGLALEKRLPLPGRDRSWIWLLRRGDS